MKVDHHHTYSPKDVHWAHEGLAPKGTMSTEPTDTEQAPIPVYAKPIDAELDTLPGPVDDDGNAMTLQQIREELPDGARRIDIEVSMKNLMAAPQRTMAMLAAQAYAHGVRFGGHVHHEIAMESPLEGDAAVRITLLVADEPETEEQLQRKAARKQMQREEYDRQARRSQLDNVFGMKTR